MTDPIAPTLPDAEAILKAQKRRNLWLAIALVAFVAIVGVSTALRIQETDFSGGDKLYFSGYLDEAAKDEADRRAEDRADEIAAQEAASAESDGASDE